MAENIKYNEQLRVTVSQNVKKAIIDTKYTDEAISFGQAVVTHHFLDQAQNAPLKWQDTQEIKRDKERTRSPQKETLNVVPERPGSSQMSKFV
jgi:hypothetical protein